MAKNCSTCRHHAVITYEAGSEYLAWPYEVIVCGCTILQHGMAKAHSLSCAGLDGERLACGRWEARDGEAE